MWGNPSGILYEKLPATMTVELNHRLYANGLKLRLQGVLSHRVFVVY